MMAAPAGIRKVTVSADYIAKLNSLAYNAALNWTAAVKPSFTEGQALRAEALRKLDTLSTRYDKERCNG
jgi:hypothetical protein